MQTDPLYVIQERQPELNGIYEDALYAVLGVSICPECEKIGRRVALRDSEHICPQCKGPLSPKKKFDREVVCSCGYRSERLSWTCRECNYVQGHPRIPRGPVNPLLWLVEREDDTREVNNAVRVLVESGRTKELVQILRLRLGQLIHFVEDGAEVPQELARYVKAAKYRAVHICIIIINGLKESLESISVQTTELANAVAEAKHIASKASIVAMQRAMKILEASIIDCHEFRNPDYVTNALIDPQEDKKYSRILTIGELGEALSKSRQTIHGQLDKSLKDVVKIVDEFGKSHLGGRGARYQVLLKCVKPDKIEKLGLKD